MIVSHDQYFFLDDHTDKNKTMKINTTYKLVNDDDDVVVYVHDEFLMMDLKVNYENQLLVRLMEHLRK
jgi:hypothetical protein